MPRKLILKDEIDKEENEFRNCCSDIHGGKIQHKQYLAEFHVLMVGQMQVMGGKGWGGGVSVG